MSLWQYFHPQAFLSDQHWLNYKQRGTLGAASLPAASTLASIRWSVWNLTLLPSSKIHQSLWSRPPQHPPLQEGVRKSRGRGQQSLTSPSWRASLSLPALSSSCWRLLFGSIGCLLRALVTVLQGQSVGRCPLSREFTQADKSFLVQYLWSIHTGITEQVAWS